MGESCLAVRKGFAVSLGDQASSCGERSKRNEKKEIHCPQEAMVDESAVSCLAPPSALVLVDLHVLEEGRQEKHMVESFSGSFNPLGETEVKI